MSGLSISNGWWKFWGNLFGTNQKYNDALFNSIEQLNYQGAYDALYDGADPARANGAGVTALHVMGWTHAPIGIAEILVECGANVNAADRNGNTPLHMAAQFNYPDLARILLGNGANVNALNSQDQFPLDLVPPSGHPGFYDSSTVNGVLLLYGGIAHPKPPQQDVYINIGGNTNLNGYGHMKQFEFAENDPYLPEGNEVVISTDCSYYAE